MFASIISIKNSTENHDYFFTNIFSQKNRYKLKNNKSAIAKKFSYDALEPYLEHQPPSKRGAETRRGWQCLKKIPIRNPYYILLGSGNKLFPLGTPAEEILPYTYTTTSEERLLRTPFAHKHKRVCNSRERTFERDWLCAYSMYNT